MPKRKRVQVEPQGVWINRDGGCHVDDTEEAVALCRSFFIANGTDTTQLAEQLEQLKHRNSVQRVLRCLSRMRGVVETELCPLSECADVMRDKWGINIDVDKVSEQLLLVVWERMASKIVNLFS